MTWRLLIMEEIGIIKSIDGMTAKVVVSRKSSCCENCTKDSCDLPEDGIETEAINAAGAQVGQRVKIVMSTFTYLKGTFLIYVIPIVALITGAILGATYLPLFIKGTNPDLLAALGGFVLFFISLVLVRILLSIMDRKTEYRSVIEKVIE
jgi:sigma-E factor negative regulatory protein RseC